MSSSACANQHSCLARRTEIFRKPAVFTWDSECGCCYEGTARAMNAHKPEPDIEPHPLRGNGCAKPGPSASGACGRGHERAVYGRLQSGGRDAGTWACKECEKIRRAKRRAGA